MCAASLPVVRLTPKANARAIRRGFPWIYANELVLDRRTKGLAPGTVALLEDNARKPVGLVGVTPASKIAGRMLDRDPEAEIGRDWLAARLGKALSLRERVFDTPYYRLVHAEADGFPGVIIDRFGDTCVVQPNAAWAEALLPELAEALAEVTGVTTILKNAGSRGRALEGLDDVDAVLLGEAPDAPVPVEMNGATYMADLTGGQKTGCSTTSARTTASPRGWRAERRCSTSSATSAASRSRRWRAVPLRRWRSTVRPRRWHWPRRARAGWARPSAFRRARAMPSTR